MAQRLTDHEAAVLRLTTTEITVLVALIRVHAANGRATIREVTDVAGLASPSQTHHVLRRLRQADLVAWENGRAGTLRPLVQEIPT